ncbi:MAG: hypothetical protein ACI4F9_02275 [Lachnospiraceae bacterium]
MEYRKNKIKKQIIILIFCWIIFVFSAFAAAQSAVTSVVNELQTGIIDISLEEYMIDESGVEVAWEDQEYIMPGDSISKIPKITNRAMDCWVRAKVKISSELQRVDSLSLNHIEGITDDWIKIGEYFYYKKILKSKETVVLFQSIKIPAQWLKEHEKNKIKIVIQVDAVQAKNFTPNFSKDTPWGGLMIENCIHEKGYDLNKFKVDQEDNLIVHYEGIAKKLIAKPNDFFAQFGILMPGDEQRGVVKIKNKGRNSVNIFFKTEEIENAELLEKIELVIRNQASNSEKERIIYEGNLNSREIQKYLLLGCYEPNYEGNFIFSLKLPEELNNKYSLEKRKVKWYFMAQEIENSTTPTTTTTLYPTTSTSKRITSSQNSIPKKTNDSSNYTTSNPYKNRGEDGNILKKIQPKTKDMFKVEFFSVCAVFSLTGMIVTMKKLKK